MKKIISLIAAVSMLFALATSAFAYEATDAVVTGATLSGQTIEYDASSADGFVFKIVADGNAKYISYKATVTGLENAGWTISGVDGHYAEGSFSSEIYKESKVSTQYAMNASGHGTGIAILMFKAVPGAGATIDGASFTVGGTVMPVSGTNYNTINAPITYTIKAAASGPKVEATENSDGSYSVSGSETLKDKKVLFDTTNAVITVNESLTNASRLWVTYTDGENVTKKNYNIYAAVDAEGAGEWTGSTVAFGIVYDPTEGWDASKFSFEIK